MPPQIRFTTTSDGVRIAFCAHGDGPPLVFVRGWISNLELHWNDPAYRRYFEALARHFLLVRYDMRGNGLSDRRVPAESLTTLVFDLEAIIDELDLDEFVLYGATYGGLIAIAYAARHPEQVTKLILDGTYAKGAEVTTPERREWILSMLRDSPDMALQRVLSYFTNPDPNQAQFRQASARELIDPDVAVQLYSLGFSIDISSLLPKIQAPTLVLHRTKSSAVPFRLGRDLAASLPNARLIPLEGEAHHSWEGDASVSLEAVGAFLGVELELMPEERNTDAGPPVTIMFTDMQSSTALTEQLGDAVAQDIRRSHNEIVRGALAANGGKEIKHTGDGIMASFAIVSSALDASIAIQQGVASHKEEHPDSPLGIYIGLNAGEPIAEDDDLFGTSINLAARICDHAEAGQILVANVVRELAAGKGFLFSDIGEVVPKGYEEPVRLYAVRWREDS